MKKPILLLLCLALAAACAKPSGKVLFIGVDGLASWCLETALDSIPEQIPHLKQLMDEGRWTLEKRAVYKTSSAINWATIFMGVPTEMHGYRKWNSTAPDFTPYAVSDHGMPPTLFTLLKEQRPDARAVCICDWDGIGAVTDTLAMDEYRCVPYVPEQLSSPEYAREYGAPVIAAGMPDFFFFYFVDLDETGHKYGWGSAEYYECLARLDQAVGILLDTLSGSADEGNTTVVLTADHGGKPDGKHGTYDLRDFRTPLVIWGPGQKGGEIPGVHMQVDASATLVRLLGLRQPAQWRGIAL